MTELDFDVHGGVLDGLEERANPALRFVHVECVELLQRLVAATVHEFYAQCVASVR